MYYYLAIYVYIVKYDFCNLVYFCKNLTNETDSVCK